MIFRRGRGAPWRGACRWGRRWRCWPGRRWGRCGRWLGGWRHSPAGSPRPDWRGAGCSGCTVSSSSPPPPGSGCYQPSLGSKQTSETDKRYPSYLEVRGWRMPRLQRCGSRERTLLSHSSWYFDMSTFLMSPPPPQSLHWFVQPFLPPWRLSVEINRIINYLFKRAGSHQQTTSQYTSKFGFWNHIGIPNCSGIFFWEQDKIRLPSLACYIWYRCFLHPAYFVNPSSKLRVKKDKWWLAELEQWTVPLCTGEMWGDVSELMISKVCQHKNTTNTLQATWMGWYWQGLGHKLRESLDSSKWLNFKCCVLVKYSLYLTLFIILSIYSLVIVSKYSPELLSTSWDPRQQQSRHVFSPLKNKINERHVVEIRWIIPKLFLIS